MAGVKNQKWSKFKVKRRTIQRNLIAIRNKLNAQAVYKEDKEDVKKLKRKLEGDEKKLLKDLKKKK